MGMRRKPSPAKAPPAAPPAVRMTTAELARQSGIPLRTVHRMKKLPGFPTTTAEQIEFLRMQRVMGSPRPTANDSRTGKETTTGSGKASDLSKRKLEQEVLKLELANGHRTEQIIYEARQQLREEVQDYFIRLGQSLREWADGAKLTTEQRRQLNRIIQEAGR